MIIEADLKPFWDSKEKPCLLQGFMKSCHALLNKGFYNCLGIGNWLSHCVVIPSQIKASTTLCHSKPLLFYIFYAKDILLIFSLKTMSTSIFAKAFIKQCWMMWISRSFNWYAVYYQYFIRKIFFSKKRTKPSNTFICEKWNLLKINIYW